MTDSGAEQQFHTWDIFFRMIIQRYMARELINPVAYTNDKNIFKKLDAFYTHIVSPATLLLSIYLHMWKVKSLSDDLKLIDYTTHFS